MGRRTNTALIALAALTLTVGAGAVRVEPLPPEQAFVFAANSGNNTVQAVYTMPDGLYLYREKLLLTTATPGFAVQSVHYPPGILHNDPFFGEMEIYYHGVTVEAQIQGEGEFTLRVLSQGCDEQVGICYPPREDVALLRTGIAAHAAVESSAESLPAGADESAAAAAVIAEGNLWWTLVVFFGFGLLLSLTPCVLPMLPILLGIIGGDAGGRRGLMLTAAYIAGVCLSFTALGVAAGLSGQLLSVYLQQPPILAGSALLFVVLSLSMFGWYDLRLPWRAPTATGGSAGGALLMGIFSAVIVSPCVAAPLIGSLIYIGNTGDAVTGGLSLLSLSLGMSATLAVAGATAGVALPRAGEWMNDIKRMLGGLMLAVAVWVASPLLPAPLSLFFYGAILILLGVLAHALEPLPANAGSARRLLKTAGVLALLWGAVMVIGAAGGGRNPLAPLAHMQGNSVGQEEAPIFLSVDSLAAVRGEIAAAQGRPVMLDFYADWCVSCKEMEMFTLTDSRVRQQLAAAVLLRADVTANTAAHRELLEHFGLYGPPAILFFDRQGELIVHTRVIGYQSADDFLRTLRLAWPVVNSSTAVAMTI